MKVGDLVKHKTRPKYRYGVILSTLAGTKYHNVYWFGMTWPNDTQFLFHSESYLKLLSEGQ